MSGLAEALAEHGLIARGGFRFGDGEAAPSGPSGEPARAVVLVGHGGGTIWPHFRNWLAAQAEKPDDPLDAWSRVVIGSVAGRFNARAVYPFEKPWLPFQRWAIRAEGLRPSPLGILMHPQFGLWHAWRGALLFDGLAENPDVANLIEAPADPIHLCDACAGKDCMKSCPTAAVTAEGFDWQSCGTWLLSESGRDCRSPGCIARDACPHGAYRYGDAQIAFHMAARLRGLDAG